MGLFDDSVGLFFGGKFSLKVLSHVGDLTLEDDGGGQRKVAILREKWFLENLGDRQAHRTDFF